MTAARLLTSSVAALVLVAVGLGCGSGSAPSAGGVGTTATVASTSTARAASSERFDSSNWGQLDTNPAAHKGADAQFVGKVLAAPERDSKGVDLQVWEDPENSEYNTIVAYAQPDFQVSDGDYVKVSGTVKGVFNGKNAFGGSVTAPLVVASRLKVVSALAAAPPALATLKGRSITQAGITVTVEKVEFAASETRVLVRVRNGSSANVSVYGSSAKIVQGGRQVDATFSTADYPELSSDLLAGASTSGAIVFPKLPPHRSLKLVIELNSEDMNVGDYGTLDYTFSWK